RGRDRAGEQEVPDGEGVPEGQVGDHHGGRERPRRPRRAVGRGLGPGGRGVPGDGDPGDGRDRVRGAGGSGVTGGGGGEGPGGGEDERAGGGGERGAGDHVQPLVRQRGSGQPGGHPAYSLPQSRQAQVTRPGTFLTIASLPVTSTGSQCPSSAPPHAQVAAVPRCACTAAVTWNPAGTVMTTLPRRRRR